MGFIATIRDLDTILCFQHKTQNSHAAVNSPCKNLEVTAKLLD